ncbi:MAG: 4-alpha-glucanotransferase, partial [Desulfobacterales bacterium]|nr:4-alpha-glucanotransferase [Desulfobacterales bacterium]
MTAFLHNNRASGILAHITSLPSPYGIGDIGPASVVFMDYLADCAQKFWQILPIGPTSLIFDSSPYMSTSAFAGSPLLISPELLFEKRLISKSILQTGRGFSPYKVNFEAVTSYKLNLLQRAFNTFTSYNSSKDAHYQTFLEENEWLEDYALFMALKNAHGSQAWFDWPRELATRKKSHLEKARKKFKTEIEYYRFEQFIFHSQWRELKRQAKARDIKIFGDIPIYIGLDSADVWSHQNLFELNPTSLRPRRVSGVPPDYFSKTGQRWGNPLYRWSSRDTDIRDGLLAWWTKRLKT